MTVSPATVNPDPLAQTPLEQPSLEHVAPHVMTKLSSPARLEILRNTGLMDSPPEVEFDRITRMIKQLLHVDVALVSLVDTERQFFKSQCGLPSPVAEERETPLSHSFCQYVVASEEALAVTDARTNSVLKTNGAVSDLNVIGYLGVPIRSPEGMVLGSLCAIDMKPRVWTQDEKDALEDFARLIEAAIQMRALSSSAIEAAVRSDILAKEYNHRIKNTMAIASSLVRLSRRETDNIDEFSRSLQERFSALTQAHDMIAHSGGDTGLENLLARLLKPYMACENNMHISGPPVSLAQEQVVPICLLIHEFATNAAKYGAIGNEKPLDITWALKDGAIILEWQEQTSATTAASQEGGGFGSKLLSIATQQLNGTLRSMRDENMLRYTLTFPALPATA